MNNIVPLVGLTVYGITLSWVLKNQRTCECSQDWRRDYIRNFAIFGIGYTILLMTRMLPKLPPAVLLAFGVSSLVYLYSILSYIPSLHKRECTCATEGDWRDNFVFWYTLLGFILSFVIGFYKGFTR